MVGAEKKGMKLNGILVLHSVQKDESAELTGSP
ncbi:uncharacterized protein METZ01_LOCUS98370 [marine metagenome]|uniref:Uncharacterized protein n=1 Tax=marine metagenome TaxID=408172 RepID=A0A381VZ06_9ZZZZ